MSITVSPTSHENTHFIKLVDAAATELGLITTDSLGSKKPLVQVSPYPTMASQLRQGRSKHADRVPPFEDISLDNFSGGLAMLHHDEDQSRYLDGKRVDTSRKGEVLLGGLETYTTGLRNFDEYWPGNVSWTSLYGGGTESISTTFTASANYDAEKVVVILKRVGGITLSNITVTLSDSDDANPQSKSFTNDGTEILTDTVSERVEFTLGSTKSLVASTTYKLTISYSGGNSDWYIDVATSGGTPFYRVLDDTGPFKFEMIEHQGALYGVTMYEDDTASDLYILGYRGVASDNTGALDTLVDDDASWTVNEFTGCIVELVGAYAHREETPWRTIVSNTADTLTLDEDWTVVQTDNTHYIIRGTEWLLWQELPEKVTDIISSGNNLYISYGYPDGESTFYPDRFWEENHPKGTWTKTLEQEDNQTLGWIKLGYIPSSEKSSQKSEAIYNGNLYAITVTDEVKLQRYDVPYASNVDVLRKIENIWQAGDTAWIDTAAGANVAQGKTGGIFYTTAQSAFVTGDIAHLNLDRPIDMTRGWGVLFSYGLYNLGTPGNYADADDIRLVFADADGNEEYVSIGGPAWGEDELGTELFFFPRSFYLDNLACDITAITDIYIEIIADEGAVSVVVLNLDLVTDRGYATECWFGIPYGERVNHILAYAGGAGETSLKPWVITAAGVYYVEEDELKRIPLGELAEMAHPRSGEGACVNDVYLIWNHGETIQSYYAGQLKSIGPDVDYGLPEERRGIPCSMASYPGRVYTAIDAGASGVSSVIYRRAHGWHEAYRAVGNNRIQAIHAVGRADQADRLYISEGADVLWIPVSNNPQTEAGYKYTHEAVLETSRIYGGLRESDKYYHAIELITESLGASQWIEVDYRTSESSVWAKIDYTFDSSPRDNSSLVSTNDTSGRWIQFRFRMYTSDDDTSPVLVAAVIDSLERLDSANTYTYNIRLSEDFDIDLQGTPETQTGKEKYDQLRTWINSPLPLTLSSTSEWEDGKLVFIEPERTRILYSKLEGKKEVRTLQLTLIEVS